MNMLKNRNSVKFYLLILAVIFMQGCSTVSVKAPVTKTVHLIKPVAPAVPENIIWAGFSFLGDSNQRQERYPYTSKIIDDNGFIIIDKYLRNELKDFSTDGYNLHIGSGDLDSGEGLVMALGISYEDVYVVPLSGDYKVSYEIGLNLVVFDYNEREQKVITVYPLRFLRNEIFDHRPTKAENMKVIKLLYTGSGFNILKESVKRMSDMGIKPGYKNHIGVRSVRISGQANEKIPGNLTNKVIETKIAQEFEGLLSKNAYVPVVPFTGGEAIGSKMKHKFANKELELNLPDLDYFFDIELRDFAHRSSKDHEGFTSKITITAASDFNKPSLNLSKNSWVFNRLVENNDIDTRWAMYKESLSILLAEFTKQLAISESNWTKRHSITKDADKQIEDIRKLIRNSQ